MQKNVRLFKRIRMVNPVLIAAWPGMGEVALRSANYLIEKLKCEPFACLRNASYFYPTSSIINKGILETKELPQNYFYYWRNPHVKANSRITAGDLIIFLSNTQPDLSRAGEYVASILEIARLYRIKLIVSFAAMPAPIDHIQKPGIWCAATNRELIRYLQGYNLKMMNEGEITGMNGLFLGLARKAGFSGFCLLGEIPIYTIQIENPRTVFAILEKLKRILNLPLDLGDLEKQVQFIEAEINKLVDYLREGVGFSAAGNSPEPISETEIEKIKKYLAPLTGLPKSIKDKIERLFELAKKDISKVNELKQTLDKWSVYKEYEDRFLDLFKKPKEKDN